MKDSSSRLLARIAAGEDSYLELKEVQFGGGQVKGPRRDDLAAEIVAFANSRGGTVVLGVDDKKEILGIPLDNLDSAEEFVRQVCIEAIDPPVEATIEKLLLPDSSNTQRWILRVDVGQTLAVHRCRGGYFRRVGSSKRKMSHEQLVRLLQHRSQFGLIRFDETAVPNAFLSNLDGNLFNRFRTDQTTNDNETLAQKLGVAVTSDFNETHLTVAGVLLATSRPEEWMRHAFVQAVAYRGTSIADALDEANYQIDAKDIVGPLDFQVADACRFVARNQVIAACKTLGRADHPQYDMTAVFEALVNAVAHRDYSLHHSKVRIRMFSDRLEIFTPGKLVNTMTTETLPYRQATRNEVVTSLLAKCEVPTGIHGLSTSRRTLMDRRGEGVPLILQRSEALSGRPPCYEMIDESELRLTIWAATGTTQAISDEECVNSR